MPTLARSALAARLCHLCPTLSRSRGHQLALVAVGGQKSEKEVDIEQLHNTLQQRFGTPRGRRSSSAAGDRLPRQPVMLTTTSGSEPTAILPGKEFCSTQGSGNAPIAALPASCATLERFRRKLALSFRSGDGWGGTRSLAQALSALDTNGTGRLTKEELKRGLNKHGVQVTMKDMEDVFTSFKHTRNIPRGESESSSSSAGVMCQQTLDYCVLLRGVRGELNTPRTKAVEGIFRKLIKLQGGEGTFSGRAEGICTSRGAGNENVLLGQNDFGGKKVEVEALRKAFVGTRGRTSGVEKGKYDVLCPPFLLPGWTKAVTLEDFKEYYSDINAGLEGGDAQFEALLQSSWDTPGTPRSSHLKCSTATRGLTSPKVFQRAEMGAEGVNRQGQTWAIKPKPSRTEKSGTKRWGDGGQKAVLQGTLKNDVGNASPYWDHPSSRRPGTQQHCSGIGSGDRGMVRVGGSERSPPSCRDGPVSFTPPRHKHTTSSEVTPTNLHGRGSQQHDIYGGLGAKGRQHHSTKSMLDVPGGKNKSFSGPRAEAAQVVQRTFRGHRGRLVAEGVRRKTARARVEAAEEERERQREMARAGLRGRIPRPHNSTTYGF